ncbi:kinase-like domain-containing protein [Mycena maculata]|uniref:Kinase-like domain-containing protein n=1 Tax=Mycena maculata TaxID=230809 RepID=A0AAD7MXY6_9AGAR|nr:kinase-like domain-containing protein [Mycena maculata]
MSSFPPSHLLPDLTGAFVDEGYLQLVQLLGCGGFAKVYKALDTTSPSEDPVYYAVKCMRNDVAGSQATEILEQEFSMHAAVRHQPGVVTFHRVFTDGEDGEFVFMVLDLCTGGDMLDAILNRHLYVDRPALVREAFIQVLDAVEQCHAKGVYHRDVKPQNLLYSSAGDIRLADFGLATNEEDSDVFRCGTLAYISPECADENCVMYSPHESDLWAAAITLFNLVTTAIPWGIADDSDAQYTAYRADPGTYLLDAFQLTPAANDLFRWCFAADPSTRPSLAQMRRAVLNIERFSLADMLPRAPAPVIVKPVPVRAQPQSPILTPSAILSVRLLSPALIRGIPTPPSVSSSSSSSASSSSGPSTPPVYSACEATGPIAIADLLDAANVGLAAIHPPPLVPTKLYTPRPMAGIAPPLKMALEFRFLDRRKRHIATRQRFADRLRRVY